MVTCAPAMSQYWTVHGSHGTGPPADGLNASIAFCSSVLVGVDAMGASDGVIVCVLREGDEAADVAASYFIV